MSGVYAVKVVGTVSMLIEKRRSRWVLRGSQEAQAKAGDLKVKGKARFRATLTMSACYSYLMMSSKILRMRERDTFRM